MAGRVTSRKRKPSSLTAGYFSNQNLWSSQEPAGTFTVTFDNADVILDYTGFMPGLTSTDDGIIGVTDGDISPGLDTGLTNGFDTGTSNAQGSFLSAAAPNSIVETIPAKTALGAAIYTFTDITGTGLFTIN